MSITKKQKQFVEEYLKDKDVIAAYLRAGYKANKAVAAKEANKLLKQEELQKYMKTLIKEGTEKATVTSDMVLNELAKIAFAKCSDFARIVTRIEEAEGEENEVKTVKCIELVDTDELSEDERAAVASIKETRYGISVETYDKMKALELIGKHLGMFKDKTEAEEEEPDLFSELTVEELRRLADSADAKAGSVE